jgi:hypothetical protein
MAGQGEFPNPVVSSGSHKQLADDFALPSSSSRHGVHPFCGRFRPALRSSTGPVHCTAREMCQFTTSAIMQQELLTRCSASGRYHRVHYVLIVQTKAN